MERKEITLEELQCILAWTFRAIRNTYLGGGADFFHATGKHMSVEQVLEDINCSDFPKITIMELRPQERSEG